jgi:D-ribose pyranose/furanose isomerase RbsD
MDSHTKCNPILQNPDILRKLYSLLSFGNAKVLFMVCKHTASLLPQITEITIGEETYKKYKKILTHNKRFTKKMTIDIQRPLSKELKIPDFNMTKLSEIVIRAGDFTSYEMEKIFNINKITKCNDIKVLEFIFLTVQRWPKFIIRAEDKKIENLNFFCNERVEVDFKYTGVTEVTVSLETKNTSIKHLSVDGIVLEPRVFGKKSPISIETLTMNQKYPLLKKHTKVLKKEVNGTKFVIRYGNFPYASIMESKELLTVNTLRLNKLLKRIDNKSLRKIYFRGFHTSDIDTLDLRKFKKLKYVEIELLIAEKIDLDDNRIIPFLEKLMHLTGGEEEEKDKLITILLPNNDSIKIDLSEV